MPGKAWHSIPGILGRLAAEGEYWIPPLVPGTGAFEGLGDGR